MDNFILLMGSFITYKLLH